MIWMDGLLSTAGTRRYSMNYRRLSVGITTAGAAGLGKSKRGRRWSSDMAGYFLSG